MYMTQTENITPAFRPADRVASVTEYYFSRKLREIAAMKARGIDVISLGVGGPDQPPAQAVIDTLSAEAARSDTHAYQPYVGIHELRGAFADWYAKHYGVTLDPASEIQPLIGSKEGILHVSLAFLNPGDGVLVPDPGYPAYTSVSSLVGAEIFNYNLTESGGWMPDFEELESLPLERIRLMWVNYPHMPTGTPATMELFRRLVDFGRRHGIVIVNDNPYSFILNDHPLSILAVEGARDVAIEFNSLSKSHNMAGWRIAMMASNPEFIKWVLRVKSNVDSGQFRPMMLAAAEALRQPDCWYRSLNELYASRRAIAEQIALAAGCSFNPKQQGLFIWARIPDEYASAEILADRILYEANVFVTPGSIFGSNGERYIRLSLCTPQPRMEQALERVRCLNLQR